MFKKLLSGIGKSTFFKNFSGYPNNLGEKRKVMYLSQEPIFLNWFTVKQNINVFAKRRLNDNSNDIAKIINLVKLNKYTNLFPNQLSGGTKKKLLIALGLISNPEILILDEVFNGIDHSSKKELSEVLLAMHTEGRIKSLIIVSHQLEELYQFTNKIIYFKEKNNENRI